MFFQQPVKSVSRPSRAWAVAAALGVSVLGGGAWAQGATQEAGETLRESADAAARDVAQAVSGEAGSLIPEGVAWGMVLDPSVIRQSPIVQQTLAELPESRRELWTRRVDDFSQIVGLNLRRDLGRIVAFGSGFEPGSVAVAAELGPKQTNVEGLLLAGSQYESYAHGDLLIHSVQEGQDRPRIYAAVLPAEAGRPGLLVASPAAALTEGLADQAVAGAALSGPGALGERQFLRMWVDQVPADMLPENSRQSNIAKMITTLELIGSSGQQETALELKLHTVNPARARMISQMAAGFKAMIQFAAAEDAEAQKLSDLLAFVSILQDKDSATVSIRGSVSSEDVGAALDALSRTGLFKEMGLE